jgi:hypothetical protein
MTDPAARPALQLVPVLRLLSDWGVRWVLTGSTVLACYGARLIPNDLDVAPDLAADNLRRLAGALRDLDAVPAFVPDWPSGPGLAECRAWRAEPATEQNLDHLYVTRLGMVDVPPRLCGSYDELVGESTRLDIGGVPVLVCALAEVLTRLRGRTRAKDLARAPCYESLSRRVAAEPEGLSWLIDRLGGTPAG